MIGAVLSDGFKRSRTQLHRNETIELGHPDPPSFKIRHKESWCVGGDMLAHAALFLSHTTTMDDMPLVGFAPVMLQTLDIGTLFGKERKDAVFSPGRQVKMSFPAGQRQNPGFARL